jgi:hypothetical protein
MEKNNRTSRIPVRMTPKDVEQIRFKANELGLTMSSYIRNIALEKHIVIKTDKEMIRQIRYIGNNINQIAHVLNTFADGLIIADAYKQLEEYKAILQHLLEILEKK